MERVHKDRLKNVARNKTVVKKVNEVVNNCNRIYTYTLQFIKLFIISKYDAHVIEELDKSIKDDIDKPIINDPNIMDFEDDIDVLIYNRSNKKKKKKKKKKIKKERGLFTPQFIRYAIQTVTSTIDNRGRVANNDPILDELEEFYNNEFSELVGGYKPLRTNITHILFDAMTVEILTSYKNNVWMHFIQRVKRYINSMYLYNFNKKYYYLLDTKNKKDEEKYETLKKDLMKEVNIIKLAVLGIDISDNTFNNTVLINYRNSIKHLRKTLIPPLKKSLPEDLKIDPYKFVYSMLYMNNEYERLGISSHNMLPLRHSFSPRNILIDTSVIVETFCSENKAALYKDIQINAVDIWKLFLKEKVTRNHPNSKYMFNNVINTNGFTVSIHKADQDRINKKIQSHSHIKGSKQVINKDGIIKDEDEDIIDDEEDNDSNEEDEDNNEEDEIKPTIIPKKKKDDEIPYIHNLDTTTLTGLVNKIKIGGDPGVNNEMTFISEDGKKLILSAAQRRFETKITLNKQKRRDHLEKNPLIKKLIEDFTVNGKTNNYNKFKEYIRTRNILYNQVEKYYQLEFHRRLKWHTYISTQKWEHKLIDTITKFFGTEVNGTYNKDDIVIGIGDWSINQAFKGCMPSKGMGLKRLFKKHFKNTVSVVEKYTSKVCSKCKHNVEYYTKVTESATYKGKNKSYVHGLLCCTNKNCSKLWNRDINAATNILQILLGHIYTHKRPLYYEGTPLKAIRREIIKQGLLINF